MSARTSTRKTRQIYEFIEANRNAYDVRTMCRALDVTLEIRDPAGTLQPLAPSRTLCTIDAAHLEDLLRQIHTHASKLHDDLSPFRDW